MHDPEDARRSEAVNTMSFKDYTARVEYDERDNIFVGRILGPDQ